MLRAYALPHPPKHSQSGLPTYLLMFPCPSNVQMSAHASMPVICPLSGAFLTKNALDKFPLKSVKDESSTFPAVPPCFADIQKSPHPYGIPTYSRQLTYALTSQNTRNSIPFPAPSAVHLIMWVRSGSQLPGLSVRPSSPLSPLHRFKVILDSINFLHLSKSNG